MIVIKKLAQHCLSKFRKVGKDLKCYTRVKTDLKYMQGVYAVCPHEAKSDCERYNTGNRKDRKVLKKQQSVDRMSVERLT